MSQRHRSLNKNQEDLYLLIVIHIVHCNVKFFNGLLASVNCEMNRIQTEIDMYV